MPDVTLYDHRGNPIKRSELTAEPQTSRLATLHTEFEAHPSRGLTPGRLATILQGAEQGDILDQCHLFEDIEEKDAHVFAEMSKRKRALQSLDWEINPPRNPSAAEEAAADLVGEILRDTVDLPSLIFELASAIGYAYSCAEITWQRDGREWLPESIEHRPQAWFTVPHHSRNDLRLRDQSADGQPLQPLTWIKHTHKAKSGWLPRAGLHRVLAWPFLFKNYSVRDLAEFLEIYGLPLRLGTYPQGATDDEKSTLLRAVTAIGHSAAGIIPEGMMIDFKEAAKGASDPYEYMVEWCERSQSKAILGGTLTSQADGASSTNALGNVHNEVRHDLRDADALLLAQTLTRDLIYPLAILNGARIDNLRRCPRLVFQTQEAEDLALYSDALPKLVNIGLKIPASHAYKKLQIPEPDGDEPVLGIASPGALPRDEAALKAHAGCPHCAAAALKGQRPRDDTDALTDRLQADSNAAMSALIDPIREAVEQSGSFDELQRRLAELGDQLAPDALADVMAQGFATANLLGRFEVTSDE